MPDQPYNATALRSPKDRTMRLIDTIRNAVAIVGLCISLQWTDSAHAHAESTTRAEGSIEEINLQDELSRRASWSQPTDAENNRRVTHWLQKQPETTPEIMAAIKTVTQDETDTLDRLTRAICTVQKQYNKLLLDIRSAPPIEIARLQEELTQAKDDAFAANTIRLWTARELLRLGRYDEAAPLLQDLPLTTSVDPTSLLFCKAACDYWLLKIEEASESVSQLLEREKELPVRYRQLALLLENDIASVEKDSLDHISRRMKDVTKRLERGHAGPKVQAVQNGVIESLDKLIKKLEDQKKQQSSGGAGSAGGNMSDGRPMEDSQLAGGKGRGEVKKRDLSDTEGWGDLPPKEREDALQQIGRDYPAHYREAIEQYFKRLATGKQ
ncbi:MAG: hypothetical protein HOB45_11965 [Planctomycetaceae bacterium]|nr:hypothetical protein [Planctomycetaceae bacterium]MBT7729620.1 hypothetical protein [Planctomycetaceae bacterium]